MASREVHGSACSGASLRSPDRHGRRKTLSVGPFGDLVMS